MMALAKTMLPFRICRSRNGPGIIKLISASSRRGSEICWIGSRNRIQGLNVEYDRHERYPCYDDRAQDGGP